MPYMQYGIYRCRKNKETHDQGSLQTKTRKRASLEMTLKIQIFGGILT